VAGGAGGLPEEGLLTFIAHVAAALPAKRADEPLLLLHHIGDLVRRHAGGALERLRAALLRAGLGARLVAAAKGDLDEGDLVLEEGAAHAVDAAANGGGPARDANSSAGAAQNGGAHNGQRQGADEGRGSGGASSGGGAPREELRSAARGALAVAALLVLKQYLMAAYWLADDRVAEFAPKGDKKRAEEKGVVARNPKASRRRRAGQGGDTCCAPAGPLCGSLPLACSTPLKDLIPTRT
jgi:hypothetical protein